MKPFWCMVGLLCSVGAVAAADSEPSEMVYYAGKFSIVNYVPVGANDIESAAISRIRTLHGSPFSVRIRALLHLDKRREEADVRKLDSEVRVKFVSGEQSYLVTRTGLVVSIQSRRGWRLSAQEMVDLEALLEMSTGLVDLNSLPSVCTALPAGR